MSVAGTMVLESSRLRRSCTPAVCRCSCSLADQVAEVLQLVGCKPSVDHAVDSDDRDSESTCIIDAKDTIRRDSLVARIHPVLHGTPPGQHRNLVYRRPATEAALRHRKHCTRQHKACRHERALAAAWNALLLQGPVFSRAHPGRQRAGMGWLTRPQCQSRLFRSCTKYS